MAQLWFKFWAKEYLADAKIRSLTYEQRGILQTLWGFAWEEGSIPSDMKQVGMMLGINANAMRTHSDWIARFFVVDPSDSSKLLSPRLELDRMEADARGAKARESALHRWSERNANAVRPCMRPPCEQDAGQGQGQEITTLPLTGKPKRAKKGSAAAAIMVNEEHLAIFREAWRAHPRRKDSAGESRGAGNQASGATQLLERIAEGVLWSEVVPIEREYLNHPYVKRGYAEDFQKFWGPNGQWFGVLEVVRAKRGVE